MSEWHAIASSVLGAGSVAIGNVDLIVIVAYFSVILGLGVWAGLKRRGGTESAGYFLAGGSLTWPLIGMALFSTNISTIHLVSQAQEGYVNGLAYGNFEWMAPFLLITLSLFFAPFYFRSKVATLPDFLERRYSRACRDWLAAMSIISAIVIHIGFTLYTGAVVLEEMFGIDKMTSIIGASIVTGIYTIVGGLLAVVLTESLQTVILLAGAILITLVAFTRAGGWEGIATHVDPVKLTVLRSAQDPANLPWYSVFLGYPVIGLWYWCADQTIVQRVLGAKDVNHARVGPLFAGFIKILPVFIFVLPGTICLALLNQGKLTALPAVQVAGSAAAIPQMSDAERRTYQAVRDYGGQDGVVRVDYVVEQTGLSKPQVDVAMTDLVNKGVLKPKSDAVYAHMILELLPPGLRGILAAALLAALMSTVSGALNSIATLFSYDLYRRWRPDTPDHKLVIIGRIATFVAMIIAILWSPLVGHYKSIYQGVNTIISYLAPPITTVFIWGVFWRRASSRAALTTLVVGSLLGITVFALDWYKDYTGWNVQFMMAAFYLFAICSAVLVVASLVWPHQHTAESDRLVWRNPLEALQDRGWRGLGNYKLLAGLLFAIMVLLYVIFATEATQRFFGLIR
ncbi:MAG: sodium:solute symporter [Sedimentisphaerales bacterium]|nr:sodium:solute symporter [Sedimentisphaerales bacterium]